MRRIPFTAAAVSLLAVFWAAPAVADWPIFSVDATAPWQIRHKTYHTLESDVESQGGKFAITETALLLKKEYKIEKRLPVELGWSIKNFAVEDSSPVDLPASLQSKGMTLGAKFPIPYVKHPNFFLGVDAGAFFQTAKDHAFHSAAFRSKNRIYAIYRPEDRLTAVAGVMYRLDYEDGSLMPILGLKYEFNDHWSLNLLSDEPFIAYEVNDRTRWKLEFGGLGDEFEVTEGPRQGDIVKTGGVRLGLGLEHKLHQNVALTASVGWSFNRKYEYLTGARGKVVPEDALYAGYRVAINF
ncbi:MAG: hypothetical protein ACLFPX_04120 [Candidatus Omnitrophota bacterium]